MTFEERKNTLQETDTSIRVLELENEVYHVKFLQSGNIYGESLSMVCDPKHGNLDLKLSGDRIGIDLHYARLVYYTEEQTGLLKIRLDTAMEAKKELEALYETYFKKAADQ